MQEKPTRNQNVFIIGAGISGLVAAINLEKLGYSPTFLESTDRVGGRVKTDVLDGYQLDHGFQVMLDAYPMAKKYLNYKSLELEQLLPGAIVYRDGEANKFGDPLRESSFLFATLFSKLGTLSDKLKIYKLNNELKKKSLDQIFEKEENTTLEFLKAYGFSEQIIQNFFRPFFSGIFLEPNLATSSRMFEFVYKMFGEGNAMIPKAGIGAISEQLKGALKKTSFKFNSPVKDITNEKITLVSGEKLYFDFAIVATDPGKLLPNYSSTLEWKSCDNLYFKQAKRSINQPIIGLNPNKSDLVNNIFYNTSIKTKNKGDKELLSVTIVKDHDLDEKQLINKVIEELKNQFGIDGLEFLKRYQIPMALPKIEDLRYQRDESESMLTEKIALAGDHQLNGSLNAAMISGELAATIADRALSDGMLTFG